MAPFLHSLLLPLLLESSLEEKLLVRLSKTLVAFTNSYSMTVLNTDKSSECIDILKDLYSFTTVLYTTNLTVEVQNHPWRLKYVTPSTKINIWCSYKVGQELAVLKNIRIGNKTRSNTDSGAAEPNRNNSSTGQKLTNNKLRNKRSLNFNSFPNFPVIPGNFCVLARNVSIDVDEDSKNLSENESKMNLKVTNFTAKASHFSWLKAEGTDRKMESASEVSPQTKSDLSHTSSSQVQKFTLSNSLDTNKLVNESEIASKANASVNFQFADPLQTQMASQNITFSKTCLFDSSNAGCHENTTTGIPEGTEILDSTNSKFSNPSSTFELRNEAKTVENPGLDRSDVRNSDLLNTVIPPNKMMIEAGLEMDRDNVIVSDLSSTVIPKNETEESLVLSRDNVLSSDLSSTDVPENQIKIDASAILDRDNAMSSHLSSTITPQNEIKTEASLVMDRNNVIVSDLSSTRIPQNESRTEASLVLNRNNVISSESSNTTVPLNKTKAEPTPVPSRTNQPRSSSTTTTPTPAKPTKQRPSGSPKVSPSAGNSSKPGRKPGDPDSSIFDAQFIQRSAMGLNPRYFYILLVDLADERLVSHIRMLWRKYKIFRFIVRPKATPGMIYYFSPYPACHVGGELKAFKGTDLKTLPNIIERSVWNLHKCKMGVVMYSRVPTVIPVDENNRFNDTHGSKFIGQDGMFMSTLVERMNFTPVIFAPKGVRMEYGIKVVKGKFTGTFLPILNGSAELCSNGHFVKDYRDRRVDFVKPITLDYVSIMAPKASVIPPVITVLLSFEFSVWVMLCLTFITTVFVYTGYLKYAMRHLQDTDFHVPEQSSFIRNLPQQSTYVRNPPEQSIFIRNPRDKSIFIRTPPEQSMSTRKPSEQSICVRNPPEQSISNRRIPDKSILIWTPPEKSIRSLLQHPAGTFQSLGDRSAMLQHPGGTFPSLGSRSAMQRHPGDTFQLPGNRLAMLQNPGATFPSLGSRSAMQRHPKGTFQWLKGSSAMLRHPEDTFRSAVPRHPEVTWTIGGKSTMPAPKPDIPKVIFDCFRFFLSSPPPKSLMIGSCFERILVTSILAFAIVITSSFQGNLVRFLSVPVYYPDIDNLQQLEKSSLTIWTSSLSWRDIFYSDPILSGLAKKVQRWKSEQDMHDSDGNYAGFQRINVHAYKYFKDIILTGLKNNATRSLHTLSQNLITYYLAYIVIKDSPYRTRIDSLISQMDQAGLVNKWSADVIKYTLETYRTVDDRHAKREKVFTLEDLSASFIVLAVGLLVASLVMVGELSLQYYRDRKLLKVILPSSHVLLRDEKFFRLGSRRREASPGKTGFEFLP